VEWGHFEPASCILHWEWEQGRRGAWAVLCRCKWIIKTGEEERRGNYTLRPSLGTGIAHWRKTFLFILRIALPFNLPQTETSLRSWPPLSNSWCYCDFSPLHFYWATVFARMPDQISVSEFLSETTEDYNSPTTSSFTTRLQSCRNTVNVLEEVRPLFYC